jgi:hypothetical protein
MITVEYLGGLAGRDAALSIRVIVQGGVMRLRYRRFRGGWSCHLPLATIASAELTTAPEVRARQHVLAAPSAALLGQPQECLLAIEGEADHRATSVILRGPHAALLGLREAILTGRKRAAKQWRP